MSASPRADLVIEGRIATLGGFEGFGWAEAMAIAGGRVIAAGSVTEIQTLIGPGTRVWSLPPTRVVMPAITDAHIHLLSAAQEALEVRLDDAPDRAAVMAIISTTHERLTAAGDDGWMVGNGWSLDRMGGWPTAADLEAIAPGRAVSLASHDHHTRWVSAPALAAAGIGRDTPDPEGGLIRRDDEGEATGIL
ncbi:MAG: amidohydrolase family protein, partial [Candidatus Limnocylindrales bacterium]